MCLFMLSVQGGVIVVGGNAKYEVPLNLYSLAMRNQSVLGVHRGSRKQLQDLVNLVATEQVKYHHVQYRLTFDQRILCIFRRFTRHF